MLTWAFRLVVAVLVVVVVLIAVRVLLAELALPHSITLLVQLLVGLGLLIVAIRYLGMPPGSGDV